MFVHPDQRAPIARLLQFLRDGEYLASDCARAQAKLAPDAGMLFQSQAPRVMSMWMKNTYIPLDMLFIDAKGRVVHIAAQTKPHSLDTISSNEPVTMVLELRGGEAGKREIAVGDHVRASPDKP